MTAPPTPATSRDATRIIFVIHQLGSQADGGIRSITEIIMRANGLEKFVVTNIRSPATQTWSSAASIAIWPMAETAYGASRSVFTPLKQNILRLANNVRAFLLVRRLKAQVVHVNDHRAFWSAALGAKLAGAKVIFNVRDTMREGARSHARWRMCLRLCDQFLVLSQDMADRWREALTPTSSEPAHAGKFRFLYSIVDREKYFPLSEDRRPALRMDLGVESGRPALLYMARFDEKKAQLSFIERSASRIFASRPDAVLYFVGDFNPERDPYAARCAHAVRSLGLTKNIRFMGFSDRAGDWYRAADMVLLGSLREGLPRCVIEGIACGAPIISFAVSSADEILTAHECGKVVPIGDNAAMAEEVIALLDDGDRCRHYRMRGPVVAQMLFDAELNAARYVEIVKEHVG